MLCKVWAGTVAGAPPSGRLLEILTQPHLRAPESASAFQQTIGDSCAHWRLRNTDLIIDCFDIWLPRWPKEKTNILHLYVFWGTGGHLHWGVCWNDSCTNSTGLWCSDGHKSPEWRHGQGKTEAECRRVCGPTALPGIINMHSWSVCLHTLCSQLPRLPVSTLLRWKSQ